MNANTNMQYDLGPNVSSILAGMYITRKLSTWQIAYFPLKFFLIVSDNIESLDLSKCKMTDHAVGDIIDGFADNNKSVLKR